jgi:hypothetical protein
MSDEKQEFIIQAPGGPFEEKHIWVYWKSKYGTNFGEYFYLRLPMTCTIQRLRSLVGKEMGFSCPASIGYAGNSFFVDCLYDDNTLGDLGWRNWCFIEVSLPSTLGEKFYLDRQ